MKKIILLLVAVAFIVSATTFAAFAADPKEAFTIDHLGTSKGDVIFPHKKHSAEFKLACKECHHKMKADSDTPKGCMECHKPDAENDVGGEKAPAAKHNDKGTKNIFHDKCVECHKSQDKGPKKCKECHGGGD